MEQIIKGVDNFVFDTSSGIEFKHLNETDFLKKTISSLKEIMKEDFDKYLFIVFLQGVPDAIPTGTSFKTDLKKVLIFISDESGSLSDNLHTDYFAIFKSYLKNYDSTSRNIFNFSLGCVRDVPQLPIIPIRNRKFSVFFSGNLNKFRIPFYLSLIFQHYPAALSSFLKIAIRIPTFKKGLLFLKAKFDSNFEGSYLRFTSGFKQGITPKEYGRYISDSKIVLCPKGFISSESFRHYEAMRAGCVVISELLPNSYFYNSSPILQVSDWNEGIKKVHFLMKNQEEVEKISESTYKWWVDKCSEIGTAKYIYASINQLVNQ